MPKKLTEKKSITQKKGLTTKKNTKADLLIENSLMLQKTVLVLVESTNKLTKKVDSLVNLFDEAAKNIGKIKEEETRDVESLAKRLGEVIKQNKDLARGLVLLEEYVRGSSRLNQNSP